MTELPENPLVSVILTSYNYADYVAESIRSVFEQSYPNIELTIVDDGSTDNSVAVIEKMLKDAPFPAKLIQQSNKGQAVALNTGFAQATGQVVALLDSDDHWNPDKVQTVVDFMAQFPGGGIYQHQLETSAGPKRNSLISADIFQLWKEWDGGVFNIADSFDGIFFSPFVPTSGLAFSKSVLDKVFPIPEEIRTCPDAFLTRTATAYGPLVSIPATLGDWRDHGDNAGLDTLNDFENFWEPIILPALNRFYEANGLGLRLTYDPKKRSFVPAARILGERATLIIGIQPNATVRSQLNRNRSRLSLLFVDLLRLFLREKDVQRLKALLSRKS